MGTPSIIRIDHLVLTVSCIETTCKFYETVLGMEKVVFANDRIALRFGSQKINLHETGKEFEPRARQATVGAADLCFIVKNLGKFQEHMESSGVEIVTGPVARTGATGPITSIYIRDPDGNLLELSELAS